MSWFDKRKPPKEKVYNQAQVDKMFDGLKSELKTSSATTDLGSLRNRMAALMSGGYDFADTLHNIYLDYGYPASLEFFHFWNMYRRFGIAKNVIELPVDTGWMSVPEIKGSPQFNKELELIIKSQNMWQRMKGLDTRQRVGRYGGMFMRARDNKRPDQPLEGKLQGPGSLVQMVPLYESQLDVVDTEDDPMSDNFGQPTMYQFRGSEAGSRNPDNKSTFNIHPSRVIIASENADNGGIYGFSALEACYNSLMDLRKIIGAGGEGFYKNAAQSIVFNLKDTAGAKQNADLLEKFNEQYDDFVHNRSRRAMWTPGMEAKTLDSSLANPKDYFFNSLYDVAASTKIAATILIGQQTGRLASTEDSRHFLSTLNSRREHHQTEMVMGVIDWMVLFGILPASKYEIEWDDLLATSDEEKLVNANKMASVNEKQFKSGGGSVFEGEEIREAAGFEAEDMEDLSEELPADLNDEE